MIEIPVKPKRILVVDDDHDFLESMQLLLLDYGHEVIPASNGKEAVEKYAEYGPDIVLLDFKMPGIDGYETLLHIVKLDSDARVVLTSAYALDDAQYRRAVDMSLSGLLQKPIEFANLAKAIARHAK